MKNLNLNASAPAQLGTVLDKAASNLTMGRPGPWFEGIAGHIGDRR